MTGPGSTRLRWKRTGVHRKPGWKVIHLRPERDDSSTQTEQKVIHSLPEQWASPPSGVGVLAARGGAGDWYKMYMQETQGRISEPPGPPYPISTAEVRWEALSQIYGRVVGKELPPNNIVSEALWAYYTRVNSQTLSTWACQILCMITEYHMACITWGSAVTSPILPRDLAERLLPLADYASPEDQSGTTDIRVRNHRARTLRVAVWMHRLDMVLSEEPASSGSLVRS